MVGLITIRCPDRNIHALILDSACTLLVIICFEERMIISNICICVCVCLCVCGPGSSVGI